MYENELASEDSSQENNQEFIFENEIEIEPDNSDEEEQNSKFNMKKLKESQN